jgi:crotonobetainyl-CoA:carnitine CoA-transferase CaiB-like acyl-CoA transferase
VVESFKPGWIAKHGLSYENLRRSKSDIVLCSITPYGQTGPYAQRPGSGLTIEAASGLTGLCGHPDQAPYPFGYALGDVTAGSVALGAIITALYHRRRTGMGQHLDISCHDAAFAQHEQCLLEYTTTGRLLTRGGRLRLALAPYGIYRTRDGFVVTAGGFERLCNAMGRPELAQDPRFNTALSRQENAREIAAIVAEWLAGFANSTEAAKVLLEADMTAARLPDSFAEVMADPQLRERNMFAEVDHPALGKVRVMNNSFRFSETATGPRDAAPRLGQHNDEVLTGLLGYRVEKVRALLASGAVRSAN